MSPARTRPEREELVFLADLAGEAERHNDVVKQIKSIIDFFGAPLSIEERNLLSIAYKNITNNLRNSWRIIDTLQKLQAIRSPGRTRQLVLIRRQQDRIERELTDVCKDIVLLLDRDLLPAAGRGEETVFYLKMKGDYCRYLAEFSQKRERERFAGLSLDAYKQAYKHALLTLHPLHPTRLGLALNFSVFYHDVRQSPERACHLAKNAFDNAVLSVDVSDPGFDQTIKDSMAILQLLRDDLILWSGEMQDAK
ncbi:Protein BMH2 [Hypsizygus marmoreus]|uniref:Protein BMH2 n=1 Tax=Hypsizygus marmoreus TaxID=39966 RepID=A0A369JST8_HYPMA|nr:Protein BMH2 [Hypsizygus marmoreus]